VIFENANKIEETIPSLEGRSKEKMKHKRPGWVDE